MFRPNQKFRLLKYPSILTRLPAWPDGEEVVRPFLEVENWQGYYRAYPALIHEYCSRCEQPLHPEYSIHSQSGMYCRACGLALMAVEWRAE